MPSIAARDPSSFLWGGGSFINDRTRNCIGHKAISIWINTDHDHEATGERYEPSAAANPASIGAETKTIPEELRLHIAAATGGAVTELTGGLHIRTAGVLVGGIGVGSGTATQSLA
ncbi:hypothetical protein PYH37_005920 (plasmid) [Sinorhizobium numidicum]|uniref:Uncharacterized protein n=1 Tax=Sinorhizobium numidicum TaxID=680248 RepID=A0ABY8D5T7_9HYPH|nr:hypothetical protein [Sinorhizobium numidicum]WEX79563.1 hypothetical protein PYH37_005920 [Sinorhizobium numidicum]WEX85482.1 hypothetical protein PYH38_005866 [Sinorhizobium numidicum]